MKRLILTAAMAIGLSALALGARAQVQDPWDEDKHPVGSETIQHPIFEKVFPGVEFKLVKYMDTRPPKMSVVAWFGGEKWAIPHYFNTLYANVADSSRASLDDKVEAFVRLAYWIRDPDLEIVKQEEVKIEMKGWCTFNRRVIVNLHRKPGGIEQLELLMVIDQGRIGRVEVFKDGKGRGPIRTGFGYFGEQEEPPFPPSTPEFEDTILKSEIIHHPLLARVFPGVEFRLETSGGQIPLRKRVVGIFNGKKWLMTGEFNLLYAEVADRASASLDERLESFIRLKFWTRDPNLKFLLHEGISIEKEPYTFNHRFFVERMVFVWPDSVAQRIKILIAFDRDQIMRVEWYELIGTAAGPPMISSPALINSVFDSSSGQ